MLSAPISTHFAINFQDFFFCGGRLPFPPTSPHKPFEKSKVLKGNHATKKLSHWSKVPGASVLCIGAKFKAENINFPLLKLWQVKA